MFIGRHLIRWVSRITKISLALVATYSSGTTLPETYPLVEIDAGEPLPPTIDPNLEAWLKVHGEKPSPFDLDPAAFEEFAGKQDIVSRLFLKIERQVRTGSKEPLRPLVDQVLRLINDDRSSSKQEFLNHPMLAFIYLALLESNSLSSEEKAKVEGDLQKIGSRTCPLKEVFLSQLTRENLSRMDDAKIQATFASLENFRSITFRKQALSRFVMPLSSQKLALLGEPLLKAVEPFPGLIQGHPYLRAHFEKVSNGELTMNVPEFAKARSLAAKKQCGPAKDLLIGYLKKSSSEGAGDSAPGAKSTGELSSKELDMLEQTVNTAKAIDGCLRQKNKAQRSEFWRGLVQIMEETYGFAGWTEAKLRLAYIAWSDSDYEEAKPLFEEVKQKVSVSGKALSAEFRAKSIAKANFSLGRIAEAEQDPARASKLYEEYLTKYSRQENFEEAMMSLVLIHIDQNNWAQALKVLGALIKDQSLLPIDERSTTVLSFALFWDGRSNLQLGRVKSAEKAWRRLASEYYSTYYGALGHYMLEQLLDKRMLIQPSRAATFKMHNFREAFPPEERMQIRRAETLMRLGLKREAICELEELDGAEGKPERLLLRSLMLHASGQWLDAIKAYDSLPRSFRHRLPVGFERILFPRKFNDEVKMLAGKAEVDPELVHAIMRQESVFNPVARSTAGAMGLMQLMPATASVEASRLNSSYVTADERRQIKQSLSSPASLFDPLTNLTVGIHHVRTLLSIYNSPVYVLSAYNASPAAARRWINSIPSKDVLVFIEKIPYKETRAYVRLVLRNYFYYKRFYGLPTDSMSHLDIVASNLLATLKDINHGSTNH